MAVETKDEQFGSNIGKDDLKHLRLSNVKLTDCVLGQGSYGTVYKAEHDGIVCAAKQLRFRDIGIKSGRAERVKHKVKQLRQKFLMECIQHSKLHHRNIVTMLGVFYPKGAVLPVLVMELMEDDLTQLLNRTHKISMYVKLSILQDVSRGLCYLHAQNPPIVHHALYCDNILITKGLTAKIADFKTRADTVLDQALPSARQRNSTFLPDSGYFLTYDRYLPLNVFSFGCIMCHVITQEQPWESPRPSSCNGYHFRSYRNEWPNSIGKSQSYINLIDNNSIKQLVELCLQWNPNHRPHILQIHERITSILAGELMYLM